MSVAATSLAIGLLLGAVAIWGRRNAEWLATGRGDVRTQAREAQRLRRGARSLLVLAALFVALAGVVAAEAIAGTTR